MGDDRIDYLGCFVSGDEVEGDWNTDRSLKQSNTRHNPFNTDQQRWD